MKIDDINIGTGHPLLIISGPCVIENYVPSFKRFTCCRRIIVTITRSSKMYKFFFTMSNQNAEKVHGVKVKKSGSARIAITPMLKEPKPSATEHATDQTELITLMISALTTRVIATPLLDGTQDKT